jgi:predicted nucleic acid-binding protein
VLWGALDVCAARGNMKASKVALNNVIFRGFVIVSSFLELVLTAYSLGSNQAAY